MTELNLTAIYEEAEEVSYIGYVAELTGENTHWAKPLKKCAKIS